MVDFVVENGSGLSGANSFVSLSDADDYFELRVNTEWEGLDDDTKQGCLVLATDFLNTMDDAFPGYRARSDQALCWPRYGARYTNGDAISQSEIPTILKNACCELALRASRGELVPDTSHASSVTREKIGKIEVEYERGSQKGPDYPWVYSLLSRLIPRSRTAKVLRS